MLLLCQLFIYYPKSYLSSSTKNHNPKSKELLKSSFAYSNYVNLHNYYSTIFFFLIMIHRMMWVYFEVDWANLGFCAILQQLMQILLQWNQCKNCRASGTKIFEDGPKSKVLKIIPIFSFSCSLELQHCHHHSISITQKHPFFFFSSTHHSFCWGMGDENWKWELSQTCILCVGPTQNE